MAILNLQSTPQRERYTKVLYTEQKEGRLFVYHDSDRTYLMVRTTLDNADRLLNQMRDRGFTLV